MDSMDVLIIVGFVAIIAVVYVIERFINKGFDSIGDYFKNKKIDKERQQNDGFSAPVRLASRYPEIAVTAIDRGTNPNPIGAYTPVVSSSLNDSKEVQKAVSAQPKPVAKKVVVHITKYCPQCGVSYRVGQAFCANCGTSLTQSYSN